MRSPPALAMMSATSVPGLLALGTSSLIAVRLMLPALSKTGASFWPLTVMVNETGALWLTLGATPEPLSVATTSKVAVPEVLFVGV